MKMLFVVFRHSLDQDIRQLLKGLGMTAFTEAPKLFGIGEAGHSMETFTWPGHNCMIMAAMEEDQAERVVEELRAFRDQLAELQGGGTIPMRVFVFPCMRVL